MSMPTLAEGGASEAIIGTEQPQNSANFIEKHVSALAEILVLVS